MHPHGASGESVPAPVGLLVVPENASQAARLLLQIDGWAERRNHLMLDRAHRLIAPDDLPLNVYDVPGMLAYLVRREQLLVRRDS